MICHEKEDMKMEKELLRESSHVPRSSSFCYPLLSFVILYRILYDVDWGS